MRLFDTTDLISPKGMNKGILQEISSFAHGNEQRFRVVPPGTRCHAPVLMSHELLLGSGRSRYHAPSIVYMPNTQIRLALIHNDLCLQNCDM